jgi:exosortase/archaeosortase
MDGYIHVSNFTTLVRPRLNVRVCVYMHACMHAATQLMDTDIRCVAKAVTFLFQFPFAAHQRACFGDQVILFYMGYCMTPFPLLI